MKLNRVSGYKPYPIRFKHLEEQRKNVDRNAAPLDIIDYEASAIAFDILPSWKNRYVRITPFGAVTNTMTMNTISWPIGSELHVIKTTADDIDLVNVGQTFNSNVGATPTINAQWAEVVYKKVGPTEWDIYGDIT